MERETETEIVEIAERHLAAGAPQEAYAVIHRQFEEPPRFEDADCFRLWFDLLARIGRRVVGDDFSALIRHALDRPDDVETLYQLGYELYEQQLFSEASCVLWRAWRFAPDEISVIAELVVSLEALGQNGRACDVLSAASPALFAEEFFLRYLYAFNTLMCGDVQRFSAQASALAPQTPEHAFMAGRIERMQRRLEACTGLCSLDERDLRGWHFVLTGGLLSHLSPYGVDSMNGRYAYIQDTEVRCRYGLECLASQLRDLGAAPERVVSPSALGSRILATAAAEILGLPLGELDAAGPAVVVCYDLAQLRDHEVTLLHQREADRWIFAHTSCWTAPPAFAPDITTLLYQHNRAPWDEHVVIDAETGEAGSRPARIGDPAEIARTILAAPAIDGFEIARDDEELRSRLATLLGADRSLAEPAFRSRLWYGGPVRSNRF